MTFLLTTLAPRLLGAWTTEATHTHLPGVVISGRSSLELLGVDGFLLHRTWYDHAAMPDAVSLLGAEQGHDFDARGVVRLFTLTVTADGWLLERPQRGEDFGQRMTWLADPAGTVIRGTGQLSHDGAQWDDDLDVVYRRADPGADGRAQS